MTYYINVNAHKEQDFLVLLQTLKNMGILESFESSKSLAREGEPMSSEMLLATLKKSETDMDEGKSLSLKEVITRVNQWKKK